jgi:tetraacyldisaccharide 4'-kinase
MPRFEDWLFDADPGISGELIRSPFSALALLYRLIISARAAAYANGVFKSFKLAIPVVSIGNLSLGGSGKTPTAIWLAQQLASQGFKPAVSTRGYRSGAENDLLVLAPESAGKTDARAAGDEALLIARKLQGAPVLVGSDRVRAGEKAIELGANILILDDGFQHLKIARDFNLALVDGRKLLSREKIFPRGRLREPVSALARADAVVLTRAEGLAEANLGLVKKLNPSAPVFRMRYRVGNAEQLAGKRAFGFAGIADPSHFFATALGCKIELVGKKAFSDHYNYQQSELLEMGKEARAGGAELLLTTEKDLARVRNFQTSLPVKALEIEPDFFDEEPRLIELAMAKVKGMRN